MKIYWCYEQGENEYGLFVIAETRNKARMLYSSEVDIDYVDARAYIVKRNDVDDKECIIDECSPLLKKYGISYREDEI